MKSADELELFSLPIETREFASDPTPWVEQARAVHPWLSRFYNGYLIHGHRAMRDLVPQDVKMHIGLEPMLKIMGATNSRWGEFMRGLMITVQGADHKRMRGAVEPFFKPRNVVVFTDRMREVMSNLLDEWAPRGKFDFAEFASWFPISVMFDLIGADPKDLPRIKGALELQGRAFSLDPSLLPQLEEAYDLIMDFTAELVANRRAGEAKDDLLQALVDAEDQGVLTAKEVREQLYFLFAAGYDTSKNQLTLLVNALREYPEQWERCATDRKYCVLAVEEGFRLTSPIAMSRVTVEDVVYDDVLIPKGKHLLFLLSLGGRDPSVFAEPLTFNPERPAVDRHMAFGKGLHICLGMHMARLQIEEGLHLVTQRIKNPQLSGPVTWRPFPGVWGIESLPIRFEPAPAQV